MVLVRKLRQERVPIRIPQIDRHFNQELFSRLGGKLAVHNLKTGKIRHLIDDPKGCVRDPQALRR
ncbi:MAG: hypothetical protein ACLUKN_11755 [Bacilli bacterium]